MKAFWEFLQLTFWIAPKVFLFSFFEENKVRRRFYSNELFKQADQSLKKLYRSYNPYRICRNYREKKGYGMVHAYGETPLTVFAEVFERGGLCEEDCFVDLGAGRGRGVFFAASLVQCKSIGVEEVAFFCTQAEKASWRSAAPKPFLDCRTIDQFDMKGGSFFYFYSLCLEEDELVKTIAHLETMKKGARIVTVSVPLTEYSSLFSVSSSWTALYPWGKAELFLHTKV